VTADSGLDARVASVLGRVVGWPREGVRFTDVSAVWEREPDIFRALVDRMCQHHAQQPPPVLLTIEARAFLFAGAMAYALGSRVVMARKGAAPRLPREVVTQEYVSGYEDGLVMGAHRDALQPGDNVLVVDDVLAAGWSAWGGVQLVEKLGATCVGVAVAIELGHLPGRANLAQHTEVPLFAAARTPSKWSVG
jgi:adenine phosphoribosyltransferase